ncbi:protein kinase 2A, chloroplastic-like [Canna indica]|uniref:Protein kinase 2A, chloroplastic-like n=1 Tax=Canna indica TaxID=4628 RepID=A0AAQ3K432_9LILI|nr:protein kinase 2A, chloroplastic-like [Canna indica]
MALSGDVANLAQLAGLDAVSLIRMIVKAASTARVHKKNCQQFARQLTLVGNLLEQLRVSELKKHRCTREPLELLEDALRRAYILVSNCHDCKFLYLLVMGWKIVKQFKSAQFEVAQYLDLIPLITLVDIQRAREETANIKGDQLCQNSGWLMTRTSGLGIYDPFLQIFKFKEIRSATMDFSDGNIIGQGECVIVYRGWIDNTPSKAENSGSFFLQKRANNSPRTVVAIKDADLLQFEAEMNFLGSISHPNVVKLLGYCRGKKNILVYEYVAKAFLGLHLFQSEYIVMILLDKSFDPEFKQNMLLIYRSRKLHEDNFNPKISNFKHAMNGLTGREFYFPKDVCGTLEYLAPQFVAKGHLNEKIDVYGFGVLLLEILSGKEANEILRIRKSSEDERETSQQSSEVISKTIQTSEVVLYYEDFVSSCISDYQKLTILMDPALRGQYPLKGARLVAQLARSCVAQDPTSRPSMQEALETLEHIQTTGTSPAKLVLEEVSDPCPFLQDIHFSVSRTTVYESAPFDADAELSFSKLR